MYNLKMILVLLVVLQVNGWAGVKQISEIEYEEVTKSGTGDVFTTKKTLKAGEEIENKGNRPIKLLFGRKGKDGHGSL